MTEPRRSDPSTETAELLADVRSGRTDRFAALYERVSPSLYAWASLRVPRGTPVDDFLQEVWLRGLQRLRDEREQPACFRAFVYGVAKNVLLEILRRHVRASATGVADAASLIDGKSATLTSISLRLARDETLQRFLAHARSLDAEDREILVQCGIEGRPCAEVAPIIGLGQEAAWKRWQRLRERLRDAGWVKDLLQFDEWAVTCPGAAPPRLRELPPARSVS